MTKQYKRLAISSTSEVLICIKHQFSIQSSKSQWHIGADFLFLKAPERGPGWQLRSQVVKLSLHWPLSPALQLSLASENMTQANHHCQKMAMAKYQKTWTGSCDLWIIIISHQAQQWTVKLWNCTSSTSERMFKKEISNKETFKINALANSTVTHWQQWS